MKLVTANQMRDLEKRADASGNSYADMMERAGTLTARAIIDRWPVAQHRVLVLVGPGNNGGDGLVCARVLHDAQAQPLLYLWKREPSEDDVNWRLCLERGIEFVRAEEDEALLRLRAEIARADFIVDAFLGTGVARPIQGLLKSILETVKDQVIVKQTQARRFHAPTFPRSFEISPTSSILPLATRVIAVDLPTGLNPDTGALDPAAVPADLTVTFAFPKIGQYAFPGASAVGELIVADIGIPHDWADAFPLDLATPEEIRELLPERPRDSNKGTFGKAMIAVGSLEFTGAPTLAALAAARVGAGLVTLAVPRAIHPIVAGKLNESTYLPLPGAAGAFSRRSVNPLVTRAKEYDALLVGCGIGRSNTTQQFVRQLFGIGTNSRRGSDLPGAVIDADALFALAETKRWSRRAKFSVPPILTPHPGEMARLVASTTREVQRDRIGVAMQYAGEWNAVVVLKGAFTVIAAPDGHATLIPFANPALASAGTGDVLAGAIAGFLTQLRTASKDGSLDVGREDAFRAALVGAYVHGVAGELAGTELGKAGAIAGDLIPRLPEAIRALRE